MEHSTFYTFTDLFAALVCQHLNAMTVTAIDT